MNYRHAFHAGNFGDVLKHAILVCVLDLLQEKETPLALYDAQAGTGVYDLASGEASRTGEFRQGAAQVLTSPQPPAALHGYLALLRKFNSLKADGAMVRYPGSPEIFRLLRRPQDRIALNELHPRDFDTLRRRYGNENAISLTRLDAYKFLAAHLPPKERRGLILLDPAYEQPDEFQRLYEGFIKAYRRFATGCYLLWYPIKFGNSVETFHMALAASGVRKIFIADLIVRPAHPDGGLSGAGLAIVNPPWRLDERIREMLPWLARVLGQGAAGRFESRWLVAE